MDGAARKRRDVPDRAFSRPYEDAPPRNESASNGGSISGGGFSGDIGLPVVRASLFKVSLLSLDKENYYWGEQVVAEVRVENFGDRAIAFPWTVDSRISNPGRSKRASLLVASIMPIAGSDPAPKGTPVNDGWMGSSTTVL